MLTEKEKAELEILEAIEAGRLSQDEARELMELEGISVEPKKVFNKEEAADIDVWDRFVVKNLSQSPEKSFNYLQKQYPDLEFEKENDRIFARPRGSEEAFKALDPEGFDIQDVSDIAYDVGSGLVEGAGTVAAGLAGGGVASIPAAMGAGGALSAGSEALRQKLGQYAGLEQEVDPTDVAISGGLGAASPLLLGTGAGAKQALKAGVSQASQQGLLGRGYDAATRKLAPKLAETFSGASGKGIMEYAKNPQMVEQIAENPISYAKSVSDELLEAVDQKESALKQQFNQMRDSENLIDISSVKKSLGDEINTLQSKGALQTQEADRLLSLKEAYKDAFGLRDVDGEIIGEIPNAVDFQTAMNIKSSLKEVGSGSKTIFDQKGSERTLKKLEGKTLKNAFNNLNKSIDKTFDNESKAVREEWGELLKRKEILDKTMTGTDNLGVNKSYDSLVAYGRTKKGKKIERQLDPIAKDLGVNLDQRSSSLQAAEEMVNPSWIPKSSNGVVSTGRIALTAALGAQAADDTRTGAALGMMGGAMLSSPRAMRALFTRGRQAEKLVRPAAEAQIPLQQTYWNLIQNNRGE